ARVSHPNIVQVFDVGTVDGAPYISMEYVRGSNLDQLIEEGGALPERDALELILQAARGLAVAHEAGLVHRDIKPGNLMLDQRGVVKVMDFGLAKGLEGVTTLTRSGQLLGTPAYMAPEQLDAKPVDHRSDLYSLGVTLYELLTGERAFVGDTPLALIGQRLRQGAPDPKARRPDLSDGTRALVLALLSNDPGQRPATAADLGRGIERLLANFPPAPSGTGTTMVSPGTRARVRFQEEPTPSTVRPLGRGETFLVHKGGTPAPAPPTAATRRSRTPLAAAAGLVALVAAAFALFGGRGGAGPPPAAPSGVAVTPAGAPAGAPAAEVPPSPPATATALPPAPAPAPASSSAATPSPDSAPDPAGAAARAADEARERERLEKEEAARREERLAEEAKEKSRRAEEAARLAEESKRRAEEAAREAEATLAAAAEALRQGRWDEAEAGARRLRESAEVPAPAGLAGLERDLSAAREALAAARAAASRGSNREAERCLDRVAEVSPGHAGAAALREKARALPDGLAAAGADDAGRPLLVNVADGAVLLRVEAGTYPCGDDGGRPSERPAHRVRLSAFTMDRDEVTNERYGKFLAWLAAAPDPHARCRADEPPGKDHAPAFAGEPGWSDPERPVVGVDWYDAWAYASWAGLALPSEAQWEAAARGADGRRYPWGDAADAARANCADAHVVVAATPLARWRETMAGLGSVQARTTSRGSFPDGRSACGAADLAGNVWEWCADAYDTRAYAGRDGAQDPVREGAGWRVLRGGSWYLPIEHARASNRWRLPPAGGEAGKGLEARRRDVGFRCARPAG
ncbi:MAG: bifunctional serine/threonine-protein kinase/formylglycine-generating enzyme family protein, partial [Planctomycetales bacterium]|nr:bifunctional serine/threonine-protein kinase/formylglycine-generating enzyme family protein [Planctomycetales bacterium]